MTTSSTIGEDYDPLGAHLQDPYPLYARARHEEPVFWSPAVNAWVLTRYEDVRHVLRNPELFSSANSLRPLTPASPAVAAVLREGYPQDPPGLMICDGAAHRRLRAPVMRGLTAERVDAVEPFIRARAEELVDTFAGDGQAELIEQFAGPLPFSVIAHLCDLEPEDAPVAFTGSYAGTFWRTGGLAEAERVAAARDFVAFQHMCGRYVHARRAAPGRDLISQLVAALAPGDQPMSFEQESQTVRTLVTVILAGHVTTSGLIGAAVRHVLADRARWELLCRRPELIPAAVEETARYDTATHAFLRVATRAVTLGGRQLPKGAEVLVVFAAANRDPALCDRPESFDVTRAPTRHVAFGAGPHACVGATLGRRQATVALETLTRRLPGLRLAGDQDFAVRGTLTVRGLSALHLTW